VTEVYSRITGYYRPVKNWNDGKSAEFQMRKEYDIKSSMEKFDARAPKEEQTEEVAACACESDGGKLILFATKTCPNCKMACVFLDKAGLAYEKLYAEENPDLAKEYGIKQAPTLVVVREDGSFQTVANVSNIRKFIEESVNA
jgi:ribonucleoside-triphosphate reductase